MKSPFDLSAQQNDTDGKIIVGLERVSEAFRVMLWKEAKEQGLSPIQMQLMIFLRYHTKERCRVSYLAMEFNMTKATISDSVKVLLQKGYVKKEPATDSRSNYIVLTKSADQVVDQVERFTGDFRNSLSYLSEEQKDFFFQTLYQLVFRLHKSGVITIQRMCLSCVHYENDAGAHYCNFLKKNLQERDLRVDCPEHEPIE